MADGAPDKPGRDVERPEPGERRPADGTPEIKRLEPRASDGGPDVYLNVPLLKVDEISIEVENLEAHVSLATAVLDLLKLNVGADAYLGRVNLEIKGVEAQALLEVRLDNVAIIVDRVLATLDRNPEVLQHIGRGVESAAQGAGEAVGELGKGTGEAVEDVGKGAGGAVEDVGKGAGGAVEDVGKGTGQAAEGAGKAAEGAGQAVGGVAEGVSEEAGGDETAKAREGEGPASNGARPEAARGGEDDEEDPLQSALRDAGKSVRDLGRALLRTASRKSGSAEEE